jgi:phosphonate transport system substrate-binding protein
MPIQLAISPDFSAENVANWFVFNTWLQRTLGERIHLELVDDFAALRAALTADQIDLVYANPFDTAWLVRERGFQPVARPVDHGDEAAVVVSADSPVRRIVDLPSPLRVACTDAPDVEMIGRILLEPAGLDRDTIELVRRPTYVLVAKSLISGAVDAAFFLERSFAELSDLVRSKMRPLVTSRIHVVQHSLLVAPSLAGRRRALLDALLSMRDSQPRLLADLGLVGGWQEMTLDDAEFMIDLMHTLVD